MPERDARPTWTLTTPEGVPLEVRLGGLAERLTALVFDVLLLGLVALGLGLAAGLFAGMLGDAGGSTVLALLNLALFLLWNGALVVLELRGRGSTPGKRRLHLRVVARDGGPLTRGAVMARNLTRMVELTLPVQALLVPELLVPGAPAWVGLATSGWVLVFALVPLLHPENARVGDLLAGTRVIHEPVAALLPDMAQARAPEPPPVGGGDRGASETPPPPSPEAPPARWVFTPRQLDVYGVHEVQVLEDLLRRRDAHADAPTDREARAGRAVCDAIRRKIGWSGPVPDEEVWPFLRAFYRAQRAHLERELLLGRRRERKGEAPVDAEDR